MSSPETVLPSASGAEVTDFWINRAERLEAGRRRAAWVACDRANRAVGGALRHAEQARAQGNPNLAGAYVEQARQRACVAARLLKRYDGGF